MVTMTTFTGRGAVVGRCENIQKRGGSAAVFRFCTSVTDGATQAAVLRGVGARGRWCSGSSSSRRAGVRRGRAPIVSSSQRIIITRRLFAPAGAPRYSENRRAPAGAFDRLGHPHHAPPTDSTSSKDAAGRHHSLLTAPPTPSAGWGLIGRGSDPAVVSVRLRRLLARYCGA